MKKLSRILIVLCLLTALVTMFAITASAADEVVIDRVDFYFPEPEFGEDPHDYKDRITCADQELYTFSCSGVGSFAGNWIDGFTYQSCFSYNLSVTPKSGYTFNQTAVYVNDVDTGKVLNGSKQIYSHKVVLGEAVDVVELPAWPTQVQGGQIAGEGVLELPADSKYTATFKWTGYNKGHLYNDAVPVLESGKVYTLYYLVEAVEGYYFTENTRFYVGGVETAHSQSVFEIIAKADIDVEVEYIDSIDIRYTRPRNGDVREEFTVSAGETTTVTFYFVRTISDATFREGESYILRLNLQASTGYAFADSLTITFNGGDPQVLPRVTRLFCSVDHEIRFAQKVETVEFPAWPETVAPGVGGTQELPSAEAYTLKQTWLDLRTGETVQTLEAGEVYTLAYTAEPKDGYVFDENTVATVNGQECQFFGEELYLLTYRSYDLGATKIDRVDVTLPKLYKGCTPGAVSVPGGANYSLLEILWGESTTGDFADSELIYAPSFDTSIYALPVLVADPGYTFAEDVKLYFNGVEVDIAYLYLEGPMAELAGLYGTLTPPVKDGWIPEDNTWAYYVGGVKKTNSWMKDSKGWCYLGADGLMLKEDWAKDSKGWCYLDKNGYMVYDKWVQWNGSWYCINKNGYMLSSTWKKDYKDWCYLGKDGKMLVNAWQKDSKGWCYLGADGYMVRNGWAADTAGICWLDSNGYIAYSKWVQNTDGWRYVNSKGYMVYNDWAKIGDYWYAFDENGLMFSETLVRYNNKYYYMDKNGRMLTSTWFKLNGNWSYVNADGYIPLNTWVRDSKGWCYINSNGIMHTNGWVNENGKSYYLDSNGYMLTNTTRWIKGEMGLSWQYRFDSNGVASRIW